MDFSIFNVLLMEKEKINIEFIERIIREINKMDCSIIDCSGRLFKSKDGHVVLNPINSSWLLNRLSDKLS